MKNNMSEALEQVPGRLAALRKRMAAEGIDAYLVPTDDFHSSEYVGSYFMCRRYLTGFTGSAGTAVVTQDFAGLWTDGRYFLQAERQLTGTGFTLMKIDEEGVPDIHQFLKDTLKKGQCLGFDGRTVSEEEAARFEKELVPGGVHLRLDTDLAGEIWTDRPARSQEPVFSLDETYCGESRTDKILRVRRAMQEKKADHFVLSCLDDIAWLLNLRGNDVSCNPVFLAYLIMGLHKTLIYASEEAFSEELKKLLLKDEIEIRPYDSFYNDLTSLQAKRIWVCKAKVNSLLSRSLPANAEIVDEENPTMLMKAVKNETEIQNMRLAHIRDGAAVTRFIYWLKKHVAEGGITELSAAEKLYELRSAGEHFCGNSFDPIIAYGRHGAIIHYSATEETDIELQPRGFVLADTGGQYLEGTTDITRTIALGELTEEEKVYFTAVLRGHIALADAIFKEGSAGYDLDVLARLPLWEIGADYNHGTGHGVGYYLNVHEGPQRIHYKLPKGKPASAPFAPGMITSDEPGYYAPGKFGIRHENLVLCVKGEKTEYGQFLRFEPLTLVPFDLDGILTEKMTSGEKAWLNNYHQKVRETISPYLEPDEARWLAEATRRI